MYVRMYVLVSLMYSAVPSDSKESPSQVEEVCVIVYIRSLHGVYVAFLVTRECNARLLSVKFESNA